MFVECSIGLLVHVRSLLDIGHVFIPSSVVNVYLLLTPTAKSKQFYRLFHKMRLKRVFKIKQEKLF